MPDDVPAVDSPALTTALKAFASLTREQKAALCRTLDGFVSCLGQSGDVLSEKGWHNRANWGSEEWKAWETWGWYRHFCRSYAPYLRNYTATVTTVPFSKLEGVNEPEGEMMKKILNVALGQES